MPATGLVGPYALTDKEIDSQVASTSPGAYALGHVENGDFIVDYVGRSDIDLNDRLHDHVSSYQAFKFGYLGSASAAFAKECSLYHDFKPKGNSIHPARPNGTNWKCPGCRVFG